MRVFIFFNDDDWQDFNDVLSFESSGIEVTLQTVRYIYRFSYSDIFSIKIIS